MSGLKNTGKRLGNFITGKGYMTSSERRAKREAKEKKAKDEIFAQGAEAMPDPVTERRRLRREAAKRRGSRVTTVMGDTLGPGGE